MSGQFRKANAKPLLMSPNKRKDNLSLVNNLLPSKIIEDSQNNVGLSQWEHTLLSPFVCLF